MNYKLSIVTPSFNQLSWLKLCAASIADQQGIPVEHIIQDAGTGSDLESWVSSQGSARLFVETDEGMYDAINRGFRKSSGEICAYLNCDEQYLTGSLERVSQFFDEQPDVEVLFADAILVAKDGGPLSYRRTILPNRAHTRLVHLNTLTCATFFRRSIIDRGILFDTRWKTLSDSVWVEGLLAMRVRMAVMPVPLAVFTFTGENLGATQLAQKEGLARRRPWEVACIPFLKIKHRWQKWWAGAYRQHSVCYEIYTQDSPHHRKRFTANDLGFRWPHSLGRQKT